MGHPPYALLRTTRAARRVALACVAFFAVAAQAAVAEDFKGLVDIGRKMYLHCRGTGSPTVVLVAGLKASADDWNTAKGTQPTVLPRLPNLRGSALTTAPGRRSVRSRAAAIRCRSRPQQGRR